MNLFCEAIFPRIFSIPSMLALLTALTLLGCATPLERQARDIEARTYELSLQRQIQAHIYPMSCQALLPLAADLLWEEGYGDSSWLGDREGLISEFKDHDPIRRSQYAILAQSIRDEECTIQALRRELTQEKNQEERDPRWELRFLDYVDDEMGRRVRFRARQEADRAYRQVIEEYGQERERERSR